MRVTALVAGVIAIGLLAGSNDFRAQGQAIDANKSSLKIRVFKSGMFSGFAHDHEIAAPIAEGRINSSTTDSSASPSVQLRVDSRQMRVLDPEASTDERDKIQHTMQGATVLDVEKFPEISYQSTSVRSDQEGRWEVRGILSLHGKKEPVVVEVSLQDGHYRGSATFKQTTFGMEPIRIAGGTVKVKDEVKIEFDIVPAR
jgi:polyisoprenoid-binding protein YceI